MNKKLLYTALTGCALSMCSASNAMTVIDDKLEIYGKLRLSIDYGQSDLGDTPEDTSAGLVDGGYGLSTNSSLIGLRGQKPFNKDYALVWQLEQNIDPDSPQGRSLGNRDTFAGFRTPVGLFRFGLLDTPYKINGIVFSRFTTTVGDPQAIIGRGGGGAQRLSLRAENSVRWDVDLLERRLKFAFQYGAGQQDTDGLADDNDSDMWSTSLAWRQGGLAAGIGYVDWSELYGSEITGLNAGVNYRLNALEVGVIFDRLKADDIDFMNRDAYGVFMTYAFSPVFTLGAQWLHADESDAGDDQANQYSVVGTWHADQTLDLYVAASTTVNQGNGQYRTADYAHGDHINTVPGGDPSALSLGMAYKF